MTHPIFKKIGRAHRPEISAVTVKAGDHTITISGEALAALVDLAERRVETLGQVLAEAIGVQRTIV